MVKVVSSQTTFVWWLSKRAVKLGPDAVRQFKALKAAEGVRPQTAMLAVFGDDNAAIEGQNRFRLRRPSG